MYAATRMSDRIASTSIATLVCASCSFTSAILKSSRSKYAVFTIPFMWLIMAPAKHTNDGIARAMNCMTFLSTLLYGLVDACYREKKRCGGGGYIECETGCVEGIVQAKSSVYCTVRRSRSMLLYGLTFVLNVCIGLTCTASCTTFNPRAIITLWWWSNENKASERIFCLGQCIVLVCGDV